MTFIVITVPVFDGQEVQFQLEESLRHLHTLLPPFKGEIPSGSLALISYTANAYYHMQKSEQVGQQRSQVNRNLALNINWAIVLGILK